MKPLSAILITGLLSFLGASCIQSSDAKTIDNSTVSSLDLNRYLGTWYEIARFDHSFERGLVGCKAEYSLMDNGLIKVINSGHKGSLSGKYKVAKGKARLRESAGPGKLQVTFFLNFWSDYDILELADDYRYVLIGSSSDKYLWILSRTPNMTQEDLDFVLARAKQRGYDTSKLIWVEQK
jgi:Bacterial lipocalin